MATKVKNQISMYDNIVDDKELEEILEDREQLKQSVSEFRKTDKKAKDKIRSIETPTPYRVGRFIISKQIVPPKSVTFETSESFRFSIKPINEA